MKKYLLLILSVAIVLWSCKGHVDKGVVVGKRYEPERFYTYTTFTMAGKVMIPHIWHVRDSEDFVLTIEGDNESGELIHEDIYVTKNYYNSILIGEDWCRTNDCRNEDFNNDKTKGE